MQGNYSSIEALVRRGADLDVESTCEELDQVTPLLAVAKERGPHVVPTICLLLRLGEYRVVGSRLPRTMTCFQCSPIYRVSKTKSKFQLTMVINHAPLYVGASKPAPLEWLDCLEVEEQEDLREWYVTPNLVTSF